MDLPPGAPGGAGMYAEVIINDVNAKVKDLPVVPREALVWRGSLPGVYVMNESNKRELRLIRIGDDVGTDGVAVLSGLRAGERVVVKGEGSGKPSSSWK
jgi:multidrug efflux pump subunit AcrA (membrane-fusion protein)